MLEEWERLYRLVENRDRGSMVAIRDGGSDFNLYINNLSFFIINKQNISIFTIYYIIFLI